MRTSHVVRCTVRQDRMIWNRTISEPPAALAREQGIAQRHVDCDSRSGYRVVLVDIGEESQAQNSHARAASGELVGEPWGCESSPSSFRNSCSKFARASGISF